MDNLRPGAKSQLFQSSQNKNGLFGGNGSPNDG